MKPVRTAINEEQYKKFMKHVNRMKISEYALTKKIVLAFLEAEDFWKIEEGIGLNIGFWFLCYSLIVATILLLA